MIHLFEVGFWPSFCWIVGRKKKVWLPGSIILQLDIKLKKKLSKSLAFLQLSNDELTENRRLFVYICVKINSKRNKKRSQRDLKKITNANGWDWMQKKTSVFESGSHPICLLLICIETK